MGRAAKYTDERILDAAIALVAEEGVAAATVSAIARRLGAPSGSIYHRFPSRDLLLATLWLRTVQQFQQGFLTALDDEDLLAAAREAVRHTVEWSAAHPSEAALMAMYRRDDLIARWPEELGDELARLNDDVTRAVRRFAEAHFGVLDAATVGRTWFALVHIPYAAVRDALRSPRAAAWLPDAVLSASLGVLMSDDRAGAASATTGPQSARRAWPGLTRNYSDADPRAEGAVRPPADSSGGVAPTAAPAGSAGISRTRRSAESRT